VKDRFTRLSDKDGCRVEDCRVDWEKHLPQFVVPIFRPNKPTTITIKLAKCIYSALLHEKKVGWGIIVHKLAAREAVKIGGTKGCFLTPFLYHLYSHHECLTDREKVRLEKCPKQPDRNPARNQADNSGGKGNPDEGADEQSNRSEPGGEEASQPDEEDKLDRVSDERGGRNRKGMNRMRGAHSKRAPGGNIRRRGRTLSGARRRATTTSRSSPHPGRRRTGWRARDGKQEGEPGTHEQAQEAQE
jgi:hypothetical protein